MSPTSADPSGSSPPVSTPALSTSSNSSNSDKAKGKLPGTRKSPKERLTEKRNLQKEARSIVSNKNRFSLHEGEGEGDPEDDVPFLPPNQQALPACASVPADTPATDVTHHPDHPENNIMLAPSQQAGASPSSALSIDQELLERVLDRKLSALAKSTEVERVMERVDQNAANITLMNIKVKELEVKLANKELAAEHRIRDIVGAVIDEKEKALETRTMSALETCSSDLSGPMHASQRNQDNRRLQDEGRRKQYEKSRRSLRLWPIQGNNDDEMREEVEAFLAGALLFSSEEITEFGIGHIRRIPPTRNNMTGIRQEVCVTFATVEARDTISRKGFLLSSYVTPDLKPTAGMRMDVPPFLMSTFNLLRGMGFDLRRQHGKGTRKYVKFDDTRCDLFLEVRPEGSTSWIRIDSDMAREHRRENDQKSLRRLLQHNFTSSAADTTGAISPTSSHLDAPNRLLLRPRSP